MSDMNNLEWNDFSNPETAFNEQLLTLPTFRSTGY